MRKTLPRDFETLLTRATPDELVSVFDRTRIDARGGSAKATAIGFVDCPDELIRWLVAQGLDVDATDTFGATPLHVRAARGRPEQIPLLLALGTDIERPHRFGGTPLHAG